jgi:hypothetical protein
MAATAPETEIVTDALAVLRKDPSHPVRFRVNDMDVELRALPRSNRKGPGLGSQMAALGPWLGESLEELTTILTESRRSGGSASAPEDS